MSMNCKTDYTQLYQVTYDNLGTYRQCDPSRKDTGAPDAPTAATNGGDFATLLRAFVTLGILLVTVEWLRRYRSS